MAKATASPTTRPRATPPRAKASVSSTARKRRHQHIDDIALNLGDDQRRRGIGEGVLCHRHHDQAGGQEFVERTRRRRRRAARPMAEHEDGKKHQGGDHRCDDGLEIHLEEAPDFLGGQRPQAEPVHRAELAGRGRRRTAVPAGRLELDRSWSWREKFALCCGHEQDPTRLGRSQKRLWRTRRSTIWSGFLRRRRICAGCCCAGSRGGAVPWRRSRRRAPFWLPNWSARYVAAGLLDDRQYAAAKSRKPVPPRQLDPGDPPEFARQRGRTRPCRCRACGDSRRDRGRGVRLDRSGRRHRLCPPSPAWSLSAGRRHAPSIAIAISPLWDGRASPGRSPARWSTARRHRGLLDFVEGLGYY